MITTLLFSTNYPNLSKIYEHGSKNLICKKYKYFVFEKLAVHISTKNLVEGKNTILISLLSGYHCTLYTVTLQCWTKKKTFDRADKEIESLPQTQMF